MFTQTKLLLSAAAIAACICFSPASAETFKQDEVFSFSVDLSKQGLPSATYSLDMSNWPNSVTSWCEGEKITSIPFCGGKSGDDQSKLIKKEVFFNPKNLSVNKIIESQDGLVLRTHQVTYDLKHKKVKARVETKNAKGKKLARARIVSDKAISLVSVESLLLKQLVTGNAGLSDNLHWFEPKRSKRMVVEMQGKHDTTLDAFPSIDAQKMQVSQFNKRKNITTPMYAIYFNSKGYPLELSSQSGKWKLGLNFVGVESIIKKDVFNVAKKMSQSKLEQLYFAKEKQIKHNSLTTVSADIIVTKRNNKIVLEKKQVFKLNTDAKAKKKAIAASLNDKYSELNDEIKVSNKNNQYYASVPRGFVCKEAQDRVEDSSKEHLKYNLNKSCSQLTVQSDDIQVSLERISLEINDKVKAPKTFTCSQATRYVITKHGGSICKRLKMKLNNIGLASIDINQVKLSLNDSFSGDSFEVKFKQSYPISKQQLAKAADAIKADKKINVSRLLSNGRNSANTFKYNKTNDQYEFIVAKTVVNKATSSSRELIKIHKLKQSRTDKNLYINSRQKIVGSLVEFKKLLSASGQKCSDVKPTTQALMVELKCSVASLTKQALWK
ncbi:hypothetical protein CXF85_11165 [Colwellia sp. 75C3]|uniref:hypothetical protein n=1 Tax=Colwellia sp. 75C3 TaxID=888425 RepID=UPI000C31FCD7|nr:hypothetical protein [Colwellia sp. 75C3]PKG83282.1 hypothetical protein CXF85_11165 [Colwellia sp. 75C3]